jgi:Zn-dependent protease
MDTGAGRAIQIGSIGHTRIGAHPAWLVGVPLFSALFALLPGQDMLGRLLLAAHPVVWALSVLAHEAGHALTAQRFGVQVRSVALMPLGGVTAFEEELRSGREELWVSGAGPGVSLALALVFAMLGLATTGELHGSMQALALFNAAVFAVNVLPALPLDGGRVARATFWLLGRDRERATLFADRLGLVSGYALGGLAGASTSLIPGGPSVALATAGVLAWTSIVLVRMSFRRMRGT